MWLDGGSGLKAVGAVESSGAGKSGAGARLHGQEESGGRAQHQGEEAGRRERIQAQPRSSGFCAGTGAGRWGCLVDGAWARLPGQQAAQDVPGIPDDEVKQGVVAGAAAA